MRLFRGFGHGVNLNCSEYRTGGRRSGSGAAGVKAGFYRSKEKAARRDFEVIGGDCFGGVDGFLAVRRAGTDNSR